MTEPEVEEAIRPPVREDQRVVAAEATIGAELAVQAAEAGLALAEAQLARVKAGARPEEITVSETRLKVARAAVAEAEARRDRLSGGEALADLAAAGKRTAFSSWPRASRKGCSAGRPIILGLSRRPNGCLEPRVREILGSSIGDAKPIQPESEGHHAGVPLTVSC